MGQFSSLISESLLALHEEGLTDCIESDIGESCSVIYPPKWVDCASCAVDSIGSKPSTINIHGRPVPIFAGNMCQFCSGQGKIQQSVSESIRGLVYWRVKDAAKWKRLEGMNGVQIAENYIELVTYQTNINKVMTSDYIEAGIRYQPGKIYRYKLASEPEPLGFRGKFIICLLERTG